MTKKKLHRWALLDKSGVTRHTIEATTRPYAIQEACKRLKRGILFGLPKGWGLKKLAPVAVDSTPAPQPKAEEFKPGDPVRVVKGATAPMGTTGIVLGPGDNGGLNVRWNAGFGVRWAHPAQIERIPQNATPDPRDAEIATLKAEVERLRVQIDAASEFLTREREVSTSLRLRAEAAEAKLDDIKALLRALKIMSQTPGEEPSFQDAMWHVVEN